MAHIEQPADGLTFRTTVESSALPTGAATASAQATANSSLSTLASNLPPLALAAFGELLVARIQPQAAWRFDYGINASLYSTTTANGGTVTVDASRAKLQTTTATNGSAKVTTRNRLRYVPGIGGLLRITGVFDTPKASSYQIIGIGDAQDGLFFGYNGTSFGIMRRRAGVDTWTPQASWNGTALGETLVPQYGNIYQIRFQWLGYGLLRYYIFDKTVRNFVLVHTEAYPNTSALTHLLNPTLAPMAEVANTGNNTNLTLYTPSALAALEGGVEGPGLDPLSVGRSFDTPATVSSTSLTHLLTIRNKSTAYTGSLSNRVPLHIQSIDISRTSTGAANTTAKIFYNATTAGALTYADVNLADSPAEVSSTATTITSTDSLRSFSLSGSSKPYNTLTFDNYQHIEINPGESLSIGVVNSTAAGTDFVVTLNWAEMF